MAIRNCVSSSHADSVSADGLRQLIRRLLAEGNTDIYRRVHSEVDKALLRQLLDFVDGNQTQASQLLGISRSTLYARINELGLVIAKKVQP